MHALTIAPTLLISPERLIGRTPFIARALWLFSFDRHVSIDRALRRVTIATRRFWIWRDRCVVPFDQINRIILRAQTFSGSALASILSFGILPGADSAFFLISLGLVGGSGEINLFTVWEDETDDSGWLDSMLSNTPATTRLGDEDTSEIVNLLRDYLGVPVASR